MRRRSGALHCQTEEQLLQLASNNEMGLYYNDGPGFREVKFESEWTMSSASNNIDEKYQNFDFNDEQTQAKQQQKQLNKGKRYLQNCVVDKQLIRCSFQICIIAPKMDQLISKIVNKDSLLDLFSHTKETAVNCIYKHSTISSSPNSNVFCLETKNIDCCKSQMQKQNFPLSPKNWLKNSKNEKMIQLLIVKKHVSISQNSEIDAKRITIIHRIFIVNQKYIQNPLIKIYLQKSHYLIDMRNQTLKSNHDSPNKSNRTTIYNKIFHHKSFFDKDCVIFNKGDLSNSCKIEGENIPFRNVFHKIQERIAKNHLRKLNELLIQQRKKAVTIR